MQVILVSKRLSAARTLTIMPRHWLLAAVVFFILVMTTASFFSWLSVHWRLPLVQDLIVSLQKTESRRSEERVQSNLQLMATRLGELQAQILLLDNLGDRLARLSGLRREPSPPTGEGGPFLAAPLGADALQLEIERLSSRVERKTDELTRLEAVVLEKRVKDRLMPTTLPVSQASIGSGFGYRNDPFHGMRSRHEGIDFVAETGTPVIAAAEGVVSAAEHHPEFGNMIDIDHGDGLSSRYAHLSRTNVKPGQLVRRGETIGAVGTSGRSTGAHLHFEVRMFDVAQNPAHFLSRDGRALAKR